MPEAVYQLRDACGGTPLATALLAFWLCGPRWLQAQSATTRNVIRRRRA